MNSLLTGGLTLKLVAKRYGLIKRLLTSSFIRNNARQDIEISLVLVFKTGIGHRRIGELCHNHVSRLSRVDGEHNT